MKDYITEYKWQAKFFDYNKQKITDYDVLYGNTNYIKRLKKACEFKTTFARALKKELKQQYWSRSEYELVIELTDDNRIMLFPLISWDKARELVVDVTNDNSYDWLGFAKFFIKLKGVGNRAKIDIYDQLTYGNCFDNLVDYLWYTRLKYERYNDKFNC